MSSESEHQYLDHDHWSPSDLVTEAWLNGEDVSDHSQWGEWDDGESTSTLEEWQDWSASATRNLTDDPIGYHPDDHIPAGLHLEEYAGDRTHVRGRVRTAPIREDALLRAIKKAQNDDGARIPRGASMRRRLGYGA